MKLLKLLVLSAMVLMATVGASNGAPASILTAQPGEPGATYPTPGELIYSYPPVLFEWTNAGSMANTSYDFEVSSDPNFVINALDSNDANHTVSNCNATNQTPAYDSGHAFQSNTTYYWRVQAYTNGLCNGDFVTGGSGWAVFSFETSIPAPVYVSPVGGTLSDNLHNDLSTTPPHPFPLFQWTSVSGASGYVLEVSTVATFSSLYLDVTVPYSDTFDGGLYAGYSPSSDLPADTQLFWRVEALNSTYGPSPWSGTPVACQSGYCSFYTANTSAAPVPISINSGGTTGEAKSGKVTNDFTPGISWSEIALPAGVTFTQYEVEASTDSTFYDTTQLCFDVNSGQVNGLQYQTYQNNPNLTYAQLDTQYALAFIPGGSACPHQIVGGVNKFDPVTQYYWRVRAQTSGGYSDWSTVFSFKTSYAKVVAGFTITKDPIDRTVTFAWTNPTPDPPDYSLTVCFDANFSEGDCVVGTSQATNPYLWYIKKDKLAPGQSLWWRVRPEGPWGPGLWSDAQPFIGP